MCDPGCLKNGFIRLLQQGGKRGAGERKHILITIAEEELLAILFLTFTSW